jgi:aromatic ring-opening dioxygenase LigB subunit
MPRSVSMHCKHNFVGSWLLPNPSNPRLNAILRTGLDHRLDQRDLRYHLNMVRIVVRNALIFCIVGQLYALVATTTTARLIAAAILPHGDFAWDPSLAGFVTTDRAAAMEAAVEIAQAARATGHWLGSSSRSSSHNHNHNTEPAPDSRRERRRRRRRRRGRVFGGQQQPQAVVNGDTAGIDPDLVFLSTPHGVALSHDFGVYLDAQGSGSAEIGLDLQDNDTTSFSYTVTLPSPLTLAPTMALDLLDHLHRVFSTPNVTGIQTPSEQNLLAWAEVIPLLLIPRRRRRPNDDDDVNRRVQELLPPRQHLIWSHPLRRHDDAALADLIPELLRVGQAIGDWLDNALPQSVAVVISGDLSHVHQDSGPYGGGGAAPAIAQRMDAAIGQWANNPCHEASSLLKRAAALQPTALSCGYTGFVLLHGMLCGCDSDDNNSKNAASRQRPTVPIRDNWTSRVLVNRNVTYYGMMVVQFTRESSDTSVQ